MKTKLLYTSMLLLFAATTLSAGTRQYNNPDNGLWNDTANWTNGKISGLTDTGDVLFNADGNGKTTTLIGVTDQLTVSKLVINSGTVVMDDAKFAVASGWVAIANHAAALNVELILQNNTRFTHNANIAIGDAISATGIFTVKSGSSYTTSGYIYLGNKDAVDGVGSSGILNIEKTASVEITGTGQLVVGSTVGASGTVNVRGNLKVNSNMGFADKADSTGIFNIYGSGNVAFTTGNLWLKAGGTINLKMEDISADKVSVASEGKPTSFFWTHSSGGVPTNASTWYVDFENFSFEQGATFESGVSYLIGLISETVNIANISAINTSALGQEWTYEGFVREGNKIYAQLLYTAVPEPSTYAAIFGVLALGFAIYRRKAVKRN